MSNKIKNRLLMIYAVVFGLVIGLFVGFFLVGTAIIVLLDILFHYGDSGPDWINWLIIMMTICITFFTTRKSLSWMDNYIERKGSSKQGS